LSSWIDTNEDNVLSPSDKIDITDENGVVTWWHVDNVMITLLVENLYNVEQKMYIELNPEKFPNWQHKPISTWWHEIWPVFSRWYHLTSWTDENLDNVLGPSDIIDITDENEVVSWWHVVDWKYDIIVSKIPPPKYLDNIRYLEDPVSSWLHELYPQYSRRYHLTSWIDTNEDYILSPSDKIDITDENGVVTWWHVDVVTITMLVENIDNLEQKMYIELDPKFFPYWENIKSDPTFTRWHEIWPVFSRWYFLTSWIDENLDNVLGPSDIIDMEDEYGRVSWWHVIDVKYDIIVQQIPPPKYLDNIRYLEDPVSSWLHELYPQYSRRYHLTSWLDTNEDNVLSPSDIIDITDENGVVTWWHVDVVTITMLIENVDNLRQKMYIELDPWLFPYWEKIKSSPISTWWHEIWPVFSRWYHLTSWFDENLDNVLGPSDVIDMEDEYGRVSWWHVADVKYDIVVQQISPPEYYIKENMPDLGQHSVNWCWAAVAANSFKWYAHHGYPQLLDNLLTPALDNDYLNIIPWPGCPVGGFLDLLHEIAKDCLYLGVSPENEENIGPENTFCIPIDDNTYFYGLQEFINEQGAPLVVHEIVDNNYFSGIGESIPPEDGENVIYATPTFENYKKELERCQDVILQFNFRNTSYEPPYEQELLDHMVTGVGYFDAGDNNRWIVVADPWTTPPFGTGPDHNNQENRYSYDNLPVVSTDPFIVAYTTWVPGVGPQTLNVQVVKMVYISPAPPVVPWEGTAVFWLENLYKVGLEKDLWLYQGSKLVVKFFDYMDSPENEVVIETFSPIWQLVENENVPHPSGIGVKKARLDLTTENTGEVISTLASFTVTKDDLWNRIVAILGQWPDATSAQKDALWSEIVAILGQWPDAP
jgi:hypothetical protein